MGEWLGHSEERLREVFDLVKPRPNWKMPIAALVHKDDASAEEITTAVTFFTGSAPEVVDTGPCWRVAAEGYYAAVGA